AAGSRAPGIRVRCSLSRGACPVSRTEEGPRGALKDVSDTAPGPRRRSLFIIPLLFADWNKKTGQLRKSGRAGNAEPGPSPGLRPPERAQQYPPPGPPSRPSLSGGGRG